MNKKNKIKIGETKLLLKIKFPIIKKQSKTMFTDYFKNHEIKKLHVGCGSNFFEEWLNTDTKFVKNKIAYLDAGKKFPFSNDCFDYIFSEHIFEHLDFDEAYNMLAECNRVLKPEGVLRIATPRLDFLIELYNDPGKQIHKDYVNWATKRFLKKIVNNFDEKEYLNVFVISNFFRSFGHKIIHDKDSLNLMLKKTGFNNICEAEVGLSNHPHLIELEKHDRVIPKKFNDLETMVFEAKK